MGAFQKEEPLTRCTSKGYFYVSLKTLKAEKKLKNFAEKQTLLFNLPDLPRNKD